MLKALIVLIKELVLPFWHIPFEHLLRSIGVHKPILWPILVINPVLHLPYLLLLESGVVSFDCLELKIRSFLLHRVNNGEFVLEWPVRSICQCLFHLQP